MKKLINVMPSLASCTVHYRQLIEENNGANDKPNGGLDVNASSKSQVSR